MNAEKRKEYDEAAKKAWKTDASLRHEFPQLEDYQAYLLSRVNDDGTMREHTCKVRVGECESMTNNEKVTMSYEDEQMRSKAQQEWNNNPQLRKDFLEFEDYLCYERLRKQGRVKISGGRN